MTTTQPLWIKADTQIDQRVQQYLAGDDILLDHHLLPYDIAATIAHVRGLHSIALLDADDAQMLIAALHDLLEQFQRGDWEMDDRFEDGHSAIEWFLTDRLGEVGRRVHLGRSRNDQVLVAQRLFMRDLLAAIRRSTADCAHRCLEMAQQEQNTPMPGYTHMQRAVPSSAGLWLAALAEALIDDVQLLDMTAGWINANPLGTAAGYGVNLPLNRALTTSELAFDRMLINPMYAQNSRGKFELQALTTCWQVLQDVRRFAWDLTLFSSAEFGFITLANHVSTGSSIMPNKRNPDLAEVVRAAAAVLGGCMSEVQQTLSLPSGYQRDLQLTKAPTIRGLLHTARTMDVFTLLLPAIEFNRETMRAAIDGPMFATDKAVELAATGLPFRTAYQQVADAADHGDDGSVRSPESSIAARTSPGACGNLHLDQLQARLAELQASTPTFMHVDAAKHRVECKLN